MASALRTASRSHDEQSNINCLPHICSSPLYSLFPHEGRSPTPCPVSGGRGRPSAPAPAAVLAANQSPLEKDEWHRRPARVLDQANAQPFVTFKVYFFEGVASALEEAPGPSARTAAGAGVKCDLFLVHHRLRLTCVSGPAQQRPRALEAKAASRSSERGWRSFRSHLPRRNTRTSRLIPSVRSPITYRSKSAKQFTSLSFRLHRYTQNYGARASERDRPTGPLGMPILPAKGMGVHAHKKRLSGKEVR